MATATKKKNPVHQAIADHIAQHHSNSDSGWTWNPFHDPGGQLSSGWHDITNWLLTAGSLGDKNRGKPIINAPFEPKDQPPQSANAAAPKAPAAAATGIQSPGALQIGFQQYIMPYLQKIQQMMGATESGYQSQMSDILSGKGGVQLSPGVRSALQATQPGMNMAMQLMNQSALMSPVAGAGMDQLAQIIQNTQAAQQQASGAYEKQLLAGEGIGALGGLGGVAGVGGTPSTSSIGAGSTGAAGNPTLAGQLTQQQVLQNSLIAQGMGAGGQVSQINPLLQQQQQYQGG